MPTSQRMFLPFQQLFTDLGAIGAGWKIYTYETLTTTPKATYTTPALNVANSNPVEADADGRVPSMFVSRTNLYKAVLTDENDVVIETRDPVDSLSFSLADFSPSPTAFWGTTGGTSAAYTLNSSVDISSVGYSATQTFLITFHTACAGNPTLAIDGLAALNLKKYTGVGTKVSLIAGDVQNQTYLVRNDGTDLVILTSIPSAEGNAGIANIATQAQTNTGTNDLTIITPLKLATKPGLSVQVVNTQTGAVATGSTTIPYDDTPPQITEGDEYMTRAITPTNASNKLKIDIVFNWASNANVHAIVALFQDATAGALAAVLDFTSSSFDAAKPCTFTHYMTAGTTSETTFRVRAGMESAGTITFNGVTGARKLGGVMASSITITEIKV